MRKLLSVTALLLLPISAFAQSRIEAKNWKQLQTYDVRTLAPSLDAHNRELVAVKFNFRGKNMSHLKPNWYESSIWQPDPNARKHFADVRVMVAKKDLAAFKSITMDPSSAEELTVYGTVLRDFDSHFVFVRLLGRNAAVDDKGNATITW